MTDSSADRTYVVVSGPPGSGKTTLARALAVELDRPLVAKDTIKEALMDVLDVPDIAASRQLGRASVAVLLAVARENPGAVLESAWHRSYAAPRLSELPGDVVEAFCRCDRRIAEQRYRARSGSRVAGHFEAERTSDELWSDEVNRPVAGGWPVIDVDANHPVDVVALAARVRTAIAD